MAKNFTYGKDKYYFNIRNSSHNSITISRTSKEEATMSYESYVRVGKNCEWLGLWNGKKFVETETPVSS